MRMHLFESDNRKYKQKLDHTTAKENIEIYYLRHVIGKINI